jgi:hypothetical protein
MQHASNIVQLLKQAVAGVQVDGCLTFCEDCVVLAAMVGELLGLTHLPSAQASANAKSKLRTHQYLKALTKEPSHRSPPRLYSSAVVHINGVQDLEKAVEQVIFFFYMAVAAN